MKTNCYDIGGTGFSGRGVGVDIVVQVIIYASNIFLRDANSNGTGFGGNNGACEGDP